MRLIRCPHCHSEQTTVVGLTSSGVQHLFCEACGNRWSRSSEAESSSGSTDRSQLKQPEDEQKNSVRRVVLPNHPNRQ
jgi:transposase-like protein